MFRAIDGTSVANITFAALRNFYSIDYLRPQFYDALSFISSFRNLICSAGFFNILKTVSFYRSSFAQVTSV